MTAQPLRSLLGELTRIDPSFKRQARRYVFQASLAAATLAFVLITNDAVSNLAVATGIAASAFLVFIAPGSALSQTRRVIGGHLVGGTVGLAFGVLLRATGIHSGILLNLVAALAVGAGILVMATTDTEHPPAAGTILGLVLGSHPLVSAALVVLAACLITTSRRLLRRWLIDLI